MEASTKLNHQLTAHSTPVLLDNSLNNSFSQTGVHQNTQSFHRLHLDSASRRLCDLTPGAFVDTDNKKMVDIQGIIVPIKPSKFALNSKRLIKRHEVDISFSGMGSKQLTDPSKISSTVSDMQPRSQTPNLNIKKQVINSSFKCVISNSRKGVRTQINGMGDSLASKTESDEIFHSKTSLVKKNDANSLMNNPRIDMVKEPPLISGLGYLSPCKTHYKDDTTQSGCLTPKSFNSIDIKIKRTTLRRNVGKVSN